MNVFDSESPLSDQHTCELWYMYAKAGLTLEEARILYRLTGRVN